MLGTFDGRSYSPGGGAPGSTVLIDTAARAARAARALDFSEPDQHDACSSINSIYFKALLRIKVSDDLDITSIFDSFVTDSFFAEAMNGIDFNYAAACGILNDAEATLCVAYNLVTLILEKNIASDDQKEILAAGILKRLDSNFPNDYVFACLILSTIGKEFIKILPPKSFNSLVVLYNTGNKNDKALALAVSLNYGVNEILLMPRRKKQLSDLFRKKNEDEKSRSCGKYRKKQLIPPPGLTVS